MTAQTENPQKDINKNTDDEKIVSRRNFIKGTALAGAGAAAILQSETSDAHQVDAMNIKIPEEIPRTLDEAVKSMLLLPPNER